MVARAFSCGESSAQAGRVTDTGLAGTQSFCFPAEYRSQIGFLAGMIFKCGTQMSISIMALDLNVLTQLSHAGGEG